MRTALCILSEEKDVASAHDLLDVLAADFFSDVLFLANVNHDKWAGKGVGQRTRFINLNIRYSDENFWAKIIACLPNEIDQALVIPSLSGCTKNLLKLRHFLTDSIAAVFPVSTSHPISRVYLEPPKSIELDPSQIEAWLNRFAVAKPLEIPIFVGFSAWLNVKTLKNCIGDTDFEIAETARQRGQSLLVSDEAYVDDSACEPVATLPTSLPPAICEAFLQRHPYTSARHPLSEVNERKELPSKALSISPKIVLHVSHSWGGGLARWISDYARADGNNTHFILKSIGDWDASGKSLRLFNSIDENTCLRSWTLTTPIISSSPGSFEYSTILDEIIAEYSVSTILVSSLIGHSLDVYKKALSTLHVLHDFYPWCPPLYATWNTPCESCDQARLVNCLSANPAHRFFKDQTSGNFLAFRASFTTAINSRNIRLIAPSQSVKARWGQLAPELDPSRVTVIAHGLNQDMIDTFKTYRWDSRGPLQKLLVLGRLTAEKGEEILRSALPALLERCEVVLLGSGEGIKAPGRHPHLTIIPEYEPQELPALLGRLQPNCGLLLSTVPETFSYTLSELHAAGIPTIATRLGAFADRIEHGVTGWLIEPTAPALLACIDHLERNADDLSRVRSAIANAPIKSSGEMVAEYADLIADDRLFRSRVAIELARVTEQHDTTRAPETLTAAFNERPYKQVLALFLSYTDTKLRQTRKLPFWLRCALRRLLGVGQWLLRQR